MKTSPVAILAFALLAAACSPVAQYTESEAPNRLTLDHTTAAVDVRFAAGSDRIVPADAVRLQRLATAGAIDPSDRVTVSASGGPELSAARRAAVSAALLRYGIVVTGDVPGTAPPDRAIVATERTLVQLPDCPNWSKYSGSDHSNAIASNARCANVSNLGRMVAYPTDLAHGQPLGFAQGTPAVAAVGRYQADIADLPPAVQLGSSPAIPPATPPGRAARGAVGGGATSLPTVNASQ